MSLTTTRKAYKPFEYSWAYQYFVQSEQMHWLAREVPMFEDVRDWKSTLSQGEKNLLTQLFRFFTQADIDVAGAYLDVYIPRIKATEVRMAMASIAAREAIHIQAYSTLIDELGLPEAEYDAFMQYKEMQAKHEYMLEQRADRSFEEDMAVFSAFGEGLQLFSSFVMLLNFTRRGLMKGMGQIVAWSIRDETLHVEFMTEVFKTWCMERGVNPRDLQPKLHKHARQMVALENAFIDLAYAAGENQGLSATEVKHYIRYTADVRLRALGLEPVFGDFTSNPLPWVDQLVFGKEHTSFFENKATDYSRGALEGDWGDAF